MIQDVDEAFSIRSISNGMNPFIDKNRKMKNLITKILSSYEVKDLSVKRDLLLTLSIISIQIFL